MNRMITILAALVIAPVIAILAQTPIVAQDPAFPAEHRIAIRKTGDVAEFYDVATNEVFVPRGNNYTKLRWDPTNSFLISSLFLPEYHNAVIVEADFERMQALGYNTARVFIDLCRFADCIADVAGGLRNDFMDNVVSLLQTARRHNVFILFTANWLPDVGGYSDAHRTCPPTFEQGNCLLLSPKGVAGYRSFFEDFVQGLIDRDAPLDIILGYQLRNEVFFESNLPPLNMASGSVTTANGQTYDMASSEDKRRMVDDGLVFWANEVRDAIRRLDPTALVAAGFFPPDKPNGWRPGDIRLVQTREILRRSNLDFLDFHGYPSAGLTMDQIVENYGMTGFADKPVILGEFGAFISDYNSSEQAASSVQLWQTEACRAGFDGYLYWLWDGSEAPRVGDSVWGPLDGTGQIARALAPVYQSNPCVDGVIPNLALGKPATASQSLADSPAEQAFDGNQETGWVAGDGPVQWIEVDLGRPETIGRIALRVDQSPAGPTVHQISGRATPTSPSFLLHEFANSTEFGDWLEVTPDPPWEGFRFIRVTTTVSPSWVAWFEIEIYPPDTVATLPLPPAQVSPTDREDQLSTTPTLSWRVVAGAETYRLQVADKGKFGKVIVDLPGLSDTSVTIGPLTNDADYYWRVRAEGGGGAGPWSAERRFTVGTVVHVGREPNDLPPGFSIGEVYPNPFRETTNLEVDLPQPEEVIFEIFDVLGRRVETVLSLSLPAGHHRMTWRPKSVPSGTYLYRLRIGSISRSGRLLFLRQR